MLAMLPSVGGTAGEVRSLEALAALAGEPLLRRCASLPLPRELERGGEGLMEFPDHPAMLRCAVALLRYIHVPGQDRGNPTSPLHLPPQPVPLLGQECELRPSLVPLPLQHLHDTRSHRQIAGTGLTGDNDRPRHLHHPLRTLSGSSVVCRIPLLLLLTHRIPPPGTARRRGR